MRTSALLGLVALFVCGCASASQTQFRDEIRKAAQQSVAEAPGEASEVFRELARSAGLDVTRVYVAVRANDTLNAGALGNHHFYVTSATVALKDRCFLAGLVAHELAHDILKHAEWSATTSDVTSLVTMVLGVAAGMFVPGADFVVQEAAGLGLNAYSRSQESDADALAVKILGAAGKPAWSLRYTLERLRQRSGRDGGGWLSTHPAITERIASQPPMDSAEVHAACGWAPEGSG